MIDLMKSRNTVLGQTAFQRHGKNSSIYKHWRNKFQREIKLAKSHYYKHKVAEIYIYINGGDVKTIACHRDARSKRVVPR